MRQTFVKKVIGRPAAEKMLVWRKMTETREAFKAIKNHSPKAADVLIKDLQLINLEPVRK